jgi:hypothetical protein
MDNIFLAAGIISVIFFISKFLEMKYVDKDEGFSCGCDRDKKEWSLV